MLLPGAVLLVHCLLKAGSLRQKTAFYMSPYFFPALIALCAIALGTALVLSALREAGGGAAGRGEAHPRRLCLLLLLTAAYQALLPRLGFVPSTALYLLLALLLFGERRPGVLLTLPLAAPLLLRLLFETGLGVRLP